MEKQIKDFENRLKDNSLKITGPRQIILNLLAENKDKHLTADDVHKMLQEKNEKVGIATVYRTLSMLEKLGFINGIYLDDGCSRYQFLGSREKHEHHHLICEKCGKVIDMQDDLLDLLEKQVSAKYGFLVKNHKVKLYGICSECLVDFPSGKY